MSNNILSGNRELHLTPIELDLNALYHPPKQPLTALGVVSAFIPLFGYGWQAMTQDPETHFRHELGKRINKHKTDEANLDRKSTRLNSSHLKLSRMPSSA